MSGIFLNYTWKTLKENRSRTLVTIVGIVLSVALLAAVTLSISSALGYVEAAAIDRTGNWSIDIFSVTKEEMDQMLMDEHVESYTALQHVGYAWINSSNDYKPYLYVGGMDAYMTEQMPLTILEGRMPENETELLIPAHLEENGEVHLEVGQVLTLELGQRWLATEDHPLDQSWAYLHEKDYEDHEKFVADGRVMTYTVVGIYERPVFENRWAPGYTALTALDKEESMSMGGEAAGWELWIRLDDLSREAQEAFIRKYAPEKELAPRWTDNSTLRRYTDVSGSDLLAVLYVLGGILMALVVAGSVALIYNAFSISVTERIRQFGLLRSLGATKRQILGSVLWEGLILCVAAIPMGFVVGYLGITATVWICRDQFMTVIQSFSEDVMFTIRLSWWSFFLTVGLGIVTVLISAWIPARRALRIHPIEAIRQSQELRLAGKKPLRRQDKEVCCPWGKESQRQSKRDPGTPGQRRRRGLGSILTARLFGMEGLLASKNFQRSRRRYRSTIVSLSFSVILFICANTFCHYLLVTVEGGVDGERYDLSYYMNPDVPRQEVQETYEEMKSLAGVDESGLVISAARMFMSLDPEDMSREYRKYWEKEGGSDWQYCSVYLIEEDTYRAFLEEEGLDVDRYMYGEEPLALVYDRMRFYGEDYSVEMYLALKDSADQLELLITRDVEDYHGTLVDTEQGAQVLMYRVNEKGSMVNDVPVEERQYYLPLEEGVRREAVQIGQILDRNPWFEGGGDWLSIFLPESAAVTLGLTDRVGSSEIVLMAEEHELVYDGMLEIFGRRGNGILQYPASNAREVRALMTLIQVFSGGFLVLISLITAANIFNTISTNVMLRRREFAMLKSIGMTERGLQRILGYECLLYGGKSLLWALPISVVITWIIYQRIGMAGYFTGFYIPWSVLLIAVGAVFVIVSATMMYSRRKLRLESLADALRNENA